MRLPTTTLLCAAFFLTGCSPSKPPETTAETTPAPVRNDTLLLPSTNQVSARVVAGHMLGEPKLPGGTLGEYSVNGREYQLFVVRADTSQRAAMLLLEMKNGMPDATYLAHMGGYFGTYRGKPLYTFAKGQFLAGIVGLPNLTADPIARQFASRLQ